MSEMDETDDDLVKTLVASTGCVTEEFVADLSEFDTLLKGMLKSLKTHGNDDENITKSIRFICLREIKKTWAKGVTEIQKLQSQVQRFNNLTKNNGKLETTVACLQKEMEQLKEEQAVTLATARARQDLDGCRS